ncbi:hypothetical protein BDM02DRAFT_3118160 [Thelephora ganbajun]|uniref:Uncharacterized protein n=1 Tax=Thelephora ganbajun TaxID=370292 RepID=A0ACB6ZAY5_THEGA|nr:hypothetical protein BDM02DRAFT_3118160 [Thelephora ganbajun]
MHEGLDAPESAPEYSHRKMKNAQRSLTSYHFPCVIPYACWNDSELHMKAGFVSIGRSTQN